MRFGVYLSNGNDGWTISEAIEPFLPTYRHLAAIANMDSNEGASREGVRISLNLPLEEGNSVFTAIPVAHGSPATIATKIDEMTERTGSDGFMFS